MTEFVEGTRRGSFLLLVDTNGQRHAVRINSIQGLHDSDQDQSQTIVALPGNRMAIVPRPLEQVLDLVEPSSATIPHHRTHGTR
ncbi:hypothetical protein GAY33_08835 [Azospirillum brasilense]|uniref:hypothetical protein n=1 Tax=Azospirillum argentinense TaxID=2970906 RepID=UPI00190DB640|nr:hypothetical protein [Azospirillum argentinense]MBK3799331.1 hypothetical protein [Azospirillum argentinense]